LSNRIRSHCRLHCCTARRARLRIWPRRAHPGRAGGLCTRMGPERSPRTRSCCARAPCTRSLVTAPTAPPSAAPAPYQAHQSRTRARSSTLRHTTTARRPPACSKSTRATRFPDSCPALSTTPPTSRARRPRRSRSRPRRLARLCTSRTRQRVGAHCAVPRARARLTRAAHTPRPQAGP
jgi:hypothetical protein